MVLNSHFLIKKINYFIQFIVRWRKKWPFISYIVRLMYIRYVRHQFHVTNGNCGKTT